MRTARCCMRDDALWEIRWEMFLATCSRKHDLSWMLGITNFDVINKVSGAATVDNIVRLRCITPGLSRLIMCAGYVDRIYKIILCERVAYIRLCGLNLLKSCPRDREGRIAALLKMRTHALTYAFRDILNRSTLMIMHTSRLLNLIIKIELVCAIIFLIFQQYWKTIFHIIWFIRTLINL